jgi:hypothetical protein
MNKDPAADLRRLARDLDAAGSKLRRQIPKGMRKAAAVMIPDIRASAAGRLPKRGGLNTYVAESAIGVRVNTGARSTGVTIVGRRSKRGGAVDLEALNEGTVRHPVFRTGKWVQEKVNPGFWDDPVQKHEATVHDALVGVIDDIRVRFEAGRIGGP